MPITEAECTRAEAERAVKDALTFGAKKIEITPANGGKWTVRITN